MAEKAAIVYGRNPVREVLSGPRRVDRVWTHGRAGGEEWLELARRSGLDVKEAPGDELKSLSGSEDHQGFVAEVEPYRYSSEESLIEGKDPLIVALDQVQDPRNLGAVVRVAECAGVAGIALPERRSAAVTAAACKASAGAVEHVRIARVRNLADFLIGAKRRDFWVYGAAAATDTAYMEVDLKGPVVLVLGSEGRGLRPRVAGACDALISVPMVGEVGSLNVSAAAAVLLFEAVRQRSLTP